ncbi:MAG: DUF262 domain-containing protein [Desulfocapsaceae bacterium]|nr:DUF262 domain-containing protein [Desulfocapsaceae bacterium]
MKNEDELIIPQELAASGNLSGVEAESEEVDLQDPFDPEKISIDGKIVPMETLIRRLIQGSMRLAPAFQRNEVWDIERKSQLIESMMLKIPLPMFYVAADEKGNWDVVDGLQRLTTIKEFVLGNHYMQTRDDKDKGNGFRLKKLEFWGDKYDGLMFSTLPEGITNRILESEFRFTIINPGTPEEVKRNIFKRINTGGMPLTSQEIRHALYQGNSTGLLQELSNNGAFLDATNNSVNDSRMAARELILRFLAFSIHNHVDYPRTSDMDAFLSNTMRIINLMPELDNKRLQKIFKHSDIPEISCSNIEALKIKFTIAMIRSTVLFGGHAFRKSYGNHRKSPINKTLFEVWGNVLANLSGDQFNTLKTNKSRFNHEYSSMLNDENFVSVISRDSWKYSGVLSRYTSIQSLVNKYI